MLSIFKQMLYTQFKWVQAALLVLIVAAFALPIAAVQGAGTPWGAQLAASGGVFPGVLQTTVTPLFPILSLITGLVIGTSAWHYDHSLKHVYSNALPVSRSNYALLRLGAAALLGMMPALAVWVGSLAATIPLELPNGIHAYPHSLAIRFGLGVLVAISASFALAASGTRVVIEAATALASLFVLALMASLFTDVAYMQRLADLLFDFPGPLEIYTGNWMLIDV